MVVYMCIYVYEYISDDTESNLVKIQHTVEFKCCTNHKLHNVPKLYIAKVCENKYAAM